MALTFQIDVRKYAELGETRTLLVREKDKAGVLKGCEIATISRLPGIPDIVSSGSGHIHEIPITERAFKALADLGEFQVVEYQPLPDSPCQQFQGDYAAEEAKLRIAYGKLAQITFGSTAYQQIYFNEVMPIMTKMFQIEMAAGMAGCRITKSMSGGGK